MHCDPRDPQGPDLIQLSINLGIDKNVRFTKMLGYDWGVPDEKLCEIYNSFDIHTLSTTGEGFGVPTLESMGCGVPNVLPDYTTSRELLDGHGLCVPLSNTMMGTWNVDLGS